MIHKVYMYFVIPTLYTLQMHALHNSRLFCNTTRLSLCCRLLIMIHCTPLYLEAFNGIPIKFFSNYFFLNWDICTWYTTLSPFIRHDAQRTLQNWILYGSIVLEASFLMAFEYLLAFYFKTNKTFKWVLYSTCIWNQHGPLFLRFERYSNLLILLILYDIRAYQCCSFLTKAATDNFCENLSWNCGTP